MDLHKFVESLNSSEKTKLFLILKNYDSRITIEQWIEENDDLPNKTLNPLRYMIKYDPDSKKFMDELTVKDLRSLRNLGQLGIDEIVKRYPIIK